MGHNKINKLKNAGRSTKQHAAEWSAAVVALAACCLLPLLSPWVNGDVENLIVILIFVLFFSAFLSMFLLAFAKNRRTPVVVAGAVLALTVAVCVLFFEWEWIIFGFCAVLSGLGCGFLLRRFSRIKPPAFLRNALFAAGGSLLFLGCAVIFLLREQMLASLFGAIVLLPLGGWALSAAVVLCKNRRWLAMAPALAVVPCRCFCGLQTVILNLLRSCSVCFRLWAGC